MTLLIREVVYLQLRSAQPSRSLGRPVLGFGARDQGIRTYHFVRIEPRLQVELAAAAWTLASSMISPRAKSTRYFLR